MTVYQDWTCNMWILPLCNRLLWICRRNIKRHIMTWWSFGKMTGCFIWAGTCILDLYRRPTTRISRSSKNGSEQSTRDWTYSIYCLESICMVSIIFNQLFAPTHHTLIIHKLALEKWLQGGPLSCHHRHQYSCSSPMLIVFQPPPPKVTCLYFQFHFSCWYFINT